MNRSRTVASTIVLLIGLLLLLPYFVAGLEWTALETGVLYGIGMLALVALLLTNPAPPRTKAKGKGGEIRDIKSTTLLACRSCESSEEREFQKGDFIGKAQGKCPKCRGELYIRAIYYVDEKKGGKP